MEWSGVEWSGVDKQNTTSTLILHMQFAIYSIWNCMLITSLHKPIKIVHIPEYNAILLSGTSMLKDCYGDLYEGVRQ